MKNVYLLRTILFYRLLTWNLPNSLSALPRKKSHWPFVSITLSNAVAICKIITKVIEYTNILKVILKVLVYVYIPEPIWY